MKFVFKAKKNFGKGVPKFKTRGKNGNPGGKRVAGGGKRKFQSYIYSGRQSKTSI
jgi:transposase